ncbi:MAG: malectin domain-containing carbohydrate-binding protein [Planctomycetota bacterium]|nr:malectin domain-containing carbohydrate-binding protein [Planctomycetota bacterium]
MAEEFDPYYIWLGIPPKDQPPNHYRLLGIEQFEHHADVIDAAANRQTSYLQDMASGPHRKSSQSLLNEIAGARRCLLDAKRRAKYDAKLAEVGANDAAPAVDQKADSASVTDAPTLDPALDEKTFDSNAGASAVAQPLWKDWRVLAGGVAVAAMVVVSAVMLMGDASDPEATDGDEDSTANITNAEAPNVSLNDSKTTIEDDLSGKTDSTADASEKPAASGSETVPKATANRVEVKLVGHWTLDDEESVHSTVKDSFSTLVIKFLGKPKFDPGPLGSAIVLNGKDTAIKLDPNSFKPVAGSIAFWIQRRDNSASTPILVSDDQAGRFTLQTDANGGLSSRVGEKETLNSTTKLELQRWHHVALTWVSDGPATLFVDGKQVASHPNIGKLQTPKQPKIGVDSVGGKSVHAAIAIDDLQFFHGALLETEVSALMAGANPPAGEAVAVVKPVVPKAKAPAPKPNPPAKKTTPPAKKNIPAKKTESKPTPKKAPVPKDAYANARNARGKILLHVNLGGPDVKEDKDTTWLASKPFAKGSWGHAGGKNIADPKVQNPLQSTAVEGLSAFRATVPKGTYMVTLYFSENWINEANKRVFAYQFETIPRWILMDIRALTGDLRRPWKIRFKVGVKDELLEINFKSAPNQQPPILNAIEIEER